MEHVLVVGLGSIGMRHARVVRRAFPQARITALRRSQADTPTGLVDDVVTSVDDALRARPTAAVIASPASRHVESALPLARAGVHLLVEKPIAANSAEVPELLDACRRAGTTLMTAYNLRFSPTLVRFREMICAGAVGAPVSVRAEVGQHLSSWRPDTDYRTSVSARADLGGGVLLELSHEIDYLRWVFGEVSWVSAIARKQSALDIDVEDTVHLVLGFAGPPGSQLVAAVNLDFVRHDQTRTCVLIGESGSLRWDAIAGSVAVRHPGKQWETVFQRDAVRDETYEAEWRAFARCVESGEPPLITGEDGLATLRVVEGARASSAKGAVVQLQPPGRQQ
jgi:predicted dehydrogenase